jgi:hypothetical protein
MNQIHTDIVDIVLICNSNVFHLQLVGLNLEPRNRNFYTGQDYIGKMEFLVRVEISVYKKYKRRKIKFDIINKPYHYRYDCYHHR